ncbi:MAG: ParA family protein [Thermoanaerobaculia bacterium]|nr:ParA family protein [Thermoanaerobaculia bacterium]
MNARILSVVNQKGGVGKTTTAINFGAALAALDQRVLLVDCDPQANATRGLGVDTEGPHLYEALLGECTLGDVIHPSGFPNLDLVPSSRQLVGVEVEFVGSESWEFRLRDLLGAVAGYDLVLLDSPPSLGHLTISLLAASHGVLIPLQCEYFALEGMGELFATVRRVRQSLNPRLEIEGIVLTMYDERTNLAKEVVEEVRSHFPDRVFATVVPRNVRLAEAPSHGMPVLQYDIKSRGAQAYLALAQEYLDRRAEASATTSVDRSQREAVP